jgi:hypothetical protein
MSAPDSKTWEHAIETTLLLCAGALVAVLVHPHVHVPGWGFPAFELLATVIAAGLAWALTSHGGFTWYVLLLGGFLGAWMAWAQSAGPWHFITAGTLAAGWLLFAALGVLAVHSLRRGPAEPLPAGQDPNAALREQIEKWENLFAEHGAEGVQVLDLREERAGRVLRLQLPRSGRVTKTTLEGIAHNIEVSLRLAEGAVEFSHASSSADIVMRVREKDVLAQKITLKPEYKATTINKPFAIGLQEDGSVAMITLRELHAMIIGVTGAGKSNLINVILAQLTGMVDTIVWVIDLKGGRVAKPWLQPWFEGRTERASIDWIATTREEAALMMSAFERAIQARMDSGLGGSKITPTASTPQMILIVDEMADIFGQLKGTRKEVGEGATTNAEFIRKGETLTQKGRSEAASLVLASQRGTNSMAGSGDMKANCKMRIMLGTIDQNEARYANAASKAGQERSASMVDTPGGGVITVGGRSSLPTKFFLHDHPVKPGSETGESLCDDGCVPSCPVYRSALEAGSVRPELDRMTASAMGDAYENRWVRASESLRRPVPGVGGGAATAVRERVDTHDFEEIMRAGGMKDPERKLPPARKRMLEILMARGAMGAQVSQIVTELTKEFGDGTPERETIHRWLRKDEEAGLVHNATYGRWKIGPAPEGADRGAA